MTRLFLAWVAMALATSASQSHQPCRLDLYASDVALRQKASATEERAMRCAFKPTDKGAELTHSGTIRQIGQGLLPAGKLVMIWVVQRRDPR